MENIHVVSCKTGQGIQCLRESLTDRFRTISSSEPIILSSRAQDLVENDVLFGLDEFKKWKQEGDVVLALESLRIAADGIGKVTGDTVGVEEILGVVFLSFCIGK